MQKERKKYSNESVRNIMYCVHYRVVFLSSTLHWFFRYANLEAFHFAHRILSKDIDMVWRTRNLLFDYCVTYSIAYWFLGLVLVPHTFQLFPYFSLTFNFVHCSCYQSWSTANFLIETRQWCAEILRKSQWKYHS